VGSAATPLLFSSTRLGAFQRLIPKLTSAPCDAFPGSRAGFLMWEISTPFVHFRCAPDTLQRLGCATTPSGAPQPPAGAIGTTAEGQPCQQARSPRADPLPPPPAPRLPPIRALPCHAACLTRRWFLYKIAADKGVLYAANGVLGLLAFFLCRICWGPILSLLYWKVRGA
jgi:hypothetical protein